MQVRVGLPAYPGGQVNVTDAPLAAGPNVPMKSVPLTTSVPIAKLSAQQSFAHALLVDGLAAESQQLPLHVTFWLAIPSPQLALQLPNPNPVHTSG